jgi:hypothetical protein
MKNLILFFILVALAACSGDHKKQKPDGNNVLKAKIDSLDRKEANASKIPVDALGPTFEKVLAELKAKYDKIEKIDKQVIDGKDTFQIHQTYYCLHDSSLIVPRRYLWGGDTTKDFTTHTFASKIVLVNNGDTVLNRVFKKADFDNVMWVPLRTYAYMFDADFIGYDKNQREFAFGFTLDIPLTDVGLPAFVVVGQKGDYRVMDEYFEIERFRKN